MTDNQEVPEVPDELALLLLFMEMQMRTREELLALEEELRTGNRFFPNSDITESLDELVPLCSRVMDAGTKLYRARTIDKYHEVHYTEPIMGALITALGKYLPDAATSTLSRFDYRHMQDALNYATAILVARGETVDAAPFVEELKPLCKNGWWGYAHDDIDVPPKDRAVNGRINPRGIRYLYASNNPKASLLEVRPVLGQMAGLAEIELVDEVTLFDISHEGALQSDAYAESTHIDPNVLAEYFAQPNYGGDAGFLATQYISEYIKNVKDDSGAKVFDGLCFNSSLDPTSLNVVLFNTSRKERKYRINCSALCEVMDLNGGFNVVLPINESELLSFIDSMKVRD